MNGEEWEHAKVGDRVVVINADGVPLYHGTIADKTGPKTAMIKVGTTGGRPILRLFYIGDIKPEHYARMH